MKERRLVASGEGKEKGGDGDRLWAGCGAKKRKRAKRRGELEAWKASFSGRKALGNSNLWHGQPPRVSSLSTRSNRSSAVEGTLAEVLKCAARSSVAYEFSSLFFFRPSEKYRFHDYNASRILI